MKLKIQRPKDWKISKPMRIMLIVMAVLMGNLLAYHLISGFITSRYLDEQSKALVAVSTATVKYEDWQPQLGSVGGLRASQGVDVTTELEGMISDIYFLSGQFVEKGDPLLQLNADDDIAAWQSLDANAKLARATYERDKIQISFEGISEEAFDEDLYNLQSQEALAAQQEAIVAKKTIRAPFTGKLGISTINVGQYINPGDFIVSLQSAHPLHVDFYIPEQHFPKISVDQDVSLSVDAYPKKTFEGKINAINSMVDPDTRNILVEATIDNPKGELLPGMYAQVQIVTGKPESRLTIPQAAISYNPYGNLVYIVRDRKKDNESEQEGEHHGQHEDKKPRKEKVKEGESELYAKQRFVKLGETRGDQVVVLEGLKEGDQIVTSGQLKLKNNASIKINNEVTPSNDSNPDVPNEEKR